jgi:hypothetical protein
VVYTEEQDKWSLKSDRHPRHLGYTHRVPWTLGPSYGMILIYLLTAVGLPPGGSSTVHIYTQTVHRTTQNKQNIEQPKNKQYIEQHKYGRVRAVPRLCKLYPGICLTTEEKARKNLSLSSNHKQN